LFGSDTDKSKLLNIDDEKVTTSYDTTGNLCYFGWDYGEKQSLFVSKIKYTPKITS